MNIILLFCIFVWKVRADTNFLTGANDILVSRNTDGDLYATPFSLQIGKKDVANLPDWLQEGVPKLMCLSSRVIRRHKLPYDDGAIIPAELIPFVSLH